MIATFERAFAERGQITNDAQGVLAAQDWDQSRADALTSGVPRDSVAGGQASSEAHPEGAARNPDILHAHIAHFARQYLDLQKVRIALSNRSQRLERLAEEQGFTADRASALDLAGGSVGAHMEHLTKAERTLASQLTRLVKQHFMGDWVAATRGIGPLGFGLLIGVTGTLDWFPTVSKVWKYVGMDVRPDGRSPRREKGQKANWSPQGRVLCHQLGESIVKAGTGPYRELYDRKKAEYLARERTGPSECPFGQLHKEKSGGVVKCGLAHAHNAAMRYAVKCMLRDLWVEWHRRRAKEPVVPALGLPFVGAR